MTTSTKTFRQVIAARVPYWLPIQSTYFIEHQSIAMTQHIIFQLKFGDIMMGPFIIVIHWTHPSLKVYQQFHPCILLNV